MVLPMDHMGPGTPADEAVALFHQALVGGNSRSSLRLPLAIPVRIMTTAVPYAAVSSNSSVLVVSIELWVMAISFAKRSVWVAGASASSEIKVSSRTEV